MKAHKTQLCHSEGSPWRAVPALSGGWAAPQRGAAAFGTCGSVCTVLKSNVKSNDCYAGNVTALPLEAQWEDSVCRAFFHTCELFHGEK